MKAASVEHLLAESLVGRYVRFAHLPAETKPTPIRVCAATSAGMVELEGWAGEFAPHLFVAEIAGTIVREFGFVEAMKVGQRVFEQYKQDQPKWWKRIDGTPILNDVAVRMSEAFLATFRCLVTTYAAALRKENARLTEEHRSLQTSYVDVWEHAEKAEWRMAELLDCLKSLAGNLQHSHNPKSRCGRPHTLCTGCIQRAKAECVLDYKEVQRG